MIQATVAELRIRPALAMGNANMGSITFYKERRCSSRTVKGAGTAELKIIMNQFRALRMLLGVSQEEFGKKLGVTRSVISNIELNKTVPKSVFIDLVCQTFNVSKHWLETGEGEPFQYTEMNANGKLFDMFGAIMSENNPIKNQLLYMIFSLDATGWNIVEQIVTYIVSEWETVQQISEYIVLNKEKIQQIIGCLSNSNNSNGSDNH